MQDLENEIHQTDMEIEFERQVLEDIYVQDFIDNLQLSLFLNVIAEGGRSQVQPTVSPTRGRLSTAVVRLMSSQAPPVWLGLGWGV